MRGRVDGATVHAAPGAKRLVAQHSIATLGMYLGMGAVFQDPPGIAEGVSAAAGIGLITLGAAISLWTLWVFRSWRLRAELGADHQLCTEGPFRLVRHPIYTAMILLALGTALWVPNAFTWGGVLGIAWVGDQRARAEEAILLTAFGDDYRALMRRTRRFLPGVY